MDIPVAYQVWLNITCFKEACWYTVNVREPTEQRYTCLQQDSSGHIIILHLILINTRSFTARSSLGLRFVCHTLARLSLGIGARLRSQWLATKSYSLQYHSSAIRLSRYAHFRFPSTFSLFFNFCWLARESSMLRCHNKVIHYALSFIPTKYHPRQRAAGFHSDASNDFRSFVHSSLRSRYYVPSFEYINESIGNSDQQQRSSDDDDRDFQRSFCSLVSQLSPIQPFRFVLASIILKSFKIPSQCTQAPYKAICSTVVTSRRPARSFRYFRSIFVVSLLFHVLSCSFWCQMICYASSYLRYHHRCVPKRFRLARTCFRFVLYLVLQ